MKNVIILMIALISIQVTAQKRNHDKRGDFQKMDLSAEEIATIRTKKMTLLLDLTPSQQQKVEKMIFENAVEREKMMAARKERKENGETKKPSKEERLEMLNKKLDHKIAQKAKMKSILNKEQYERWEKAQMKMAMKSKQKREFRGERQRRG